MLATLALLTTIRRSLVPPRAATGAALLIATFSALYLHLAWTNYYHLETGTDLAGYTQALFNLSHGRLPFNTFKNIIMWGDHAHFILALLAPLYALVPDARTLLTLQALAATTAGYPLWSLAWQRTRHAFFSLALLYAYLAFVGLQYALDFDFHTIVLTGAAFLWTFWALDRQRWVAYWTALGLGLISREDAPLIFFMLGVWELFHRRWLVGGTTMAMAGTYFLLVAYVIMPLMSPGHAALLYLDLDQRDPYHIVRWLARYPNVIAQNIVNTPEKRHTLHTLGQAFAYLPLASPLTYLTSWPLIVARFASGQDYRWLLTNHSNGNIAALLAVGALLGTLNLQSLVANSARRSIRRPLLAAAALALLVGVQYTAWRDPGVPLRQLFSPASLRFDPNVRVRAAAATTLRQRIPPDAAVSASAGLLAPLANRQYLYNFPNVPDHVTWVIISPAVNPWPLTRDETEHEITRLRNNPSFELVTSTAEIFVFRRQPLTTAALDATRER